MFSLFPPRPPAHSFFIGPTVINIHGSQCDWRYILEKVSLGPPPAPRCLCRHTNKERERREKERGGRGEGRRGGRERETEREREGLLELSITGSWAVQ